jgi:uncharacterized membrane protein
MHDLLFVLIFSLLLLPIAELSQIAVLRVVFGLLYIGLLPGYALIAAVFPGHEDLEGLERLGLSLVFSISMVALTAFLLDFSPWGIRLLPLLILLNVLTLLASGIAYWRRRRLLPEEQFVFRVKLQMPHWKTANRTDRFLALILAVLVVTAITAMLYAVVMPGPQETFTEFYMLGPDGKLGGYSETTSEGEAVTVTLRVVNHEQADVQYRIELARNAGREQVASMRLGHEKAWEQSYTFTPKEPGENQKIEFLLYKEDETEPYRTLYFWITAGQDQVTP